MVRKSYMTCGCGSHAVPAGRGPHGIVQAESRLLTTTLGMLTIRMGVPCQKMSFCQEDAAGFACARRANPRPRRSPDGRNRIVSGSANGARLLTLRHVPGRGPA